MKKLYLRLLLVLVGFAGFTLSAKAQSADQVRVNIPFQFVAAGKTFPAGEYKITRLRDAEPRILLLISQENRADIIMLRALTEDTSGGRTQLDFATVGDQHLLSRIETPDHIYDFYVPRADTLLAANSPKGVSVAASSGSN